MRTMVTLACMLVLVLPQTVAAGSLGSDDPEALDEISGQMEAVLKTCMEEIRRFVAGLDPNEPLAVRLVELGECLERVTSRVCVIGGLWDPREIYEIADGVAFGIWDHYIDMVVKLYVNADSGGKIVLPLKVDFAGTSCRSPGSYGWAWEVGGGGRFPQEKFEDWWDEEP